MRRGSFCLGWRPPGTTADDGKTWIFSLRDGVDFHDGTPFTADAVVKALTRAAEQPGVLEEAPIAEMKADGSDVVIALDTAFAALPALLAHSSTVIPAPAAFDADGTPIKVIGTGPYRIEEFSPPQSMETVVFDGYWGERPAITDASYLAAGRAETRALLAESGDADLVFTIDPSGFARLGDVESVETVAVGDDPANPGQTALFVGGTTGNDKIQFTPGGRDGGVRVRVNGVEEGTFTDVDSIVVFAQ
ncbi:MAG: hypothetical protein HC871_17755, partial [Rhizobiales bacterium]|nr:hypothetical protein [Hyphomicrobiales bacterium]